MTDVQWLRHPDDRAIDEVHFCDIVPSTYEAAIATAFLRIRIKERYKTSGMSGDEWRFSTVLETRRHHDGEWVALSNGYRDIDAHAAFLYAEMFGDFTAGRNDWLYRRKAHAIAFSWKGCPVWVGTNDGQGADFLVACGHLTGALIQAGEQGTHARLDGSLCCQPGCREPTVSVYRRLKDYCRACGREDDSEWRRKRVECRSFCGKHLRRGDCALDDADQNYEVLSGPGPSEGGPDSDAVSPSRHGGTVWIHTRGSGAK